MTLTYYKDYQELFNGCVFYVDGTSLTIPVISPNTITNSNATLTSDRFGKSNHAYLFQNNGALTCGNLGTIKTLGFWVYCDNTSSMNVMSFNDSVNAYITFSSAAYGVTGVGSGGIYYSNGIVGNSIPNSQWRFLLFTTTGGNAIANLTIGKVVPSWFFTGVFGEVILWNRVLSPVEIKIIYELTRQKYIYPVIPGIRGVE